MAQIPSDKPLKKCPICGKEVRNLGYHIANIHPRSFEKIDALDEAAPVQNVIKAPISPKEPGSINEMIREKLDTMLNIKIIEMLSNGAELKDVQAVLNPAPPQAPIGIKEIKEYHDLIYSEQQPINLNVDGGESSGWLNVLNNALPIVNKFIDGRQKQEPIKMEEIKEDDTESRTFEEGTIRPIGFVQEETTIDSNESRSVSEEPRTIGESEQQNNSSPGSSN